MTTFTHATKTDLIDTILAEVSTTLSAVDRWQVTELADALSAATRVFVTGEGRSGFMAKAFAMRLMHLGLDVHVIGETTTPSVGPETPSWRYLGLEPLLGQSGSPSRRPGWAPAVHAVTTDPESPMSATADTVLIVPAATKYRRADEAPTVQPLSSLFDQTTHVLLDAVCLQLAERRGVDNATARAAHSNTD